MKIEILLTETEIAQEFSESMEARDLPEKFFYWFPLSAQMWLALARDPANDSLRQCWQSVAEKIQGIVEHFQGPVSTISFGAGEGFTDRLLLVQLQKNGREVKYFPVDASQALLETACAAAEDQEIETLGIKADISSPVHLVLASDASESPKLLLVAGQHRRLIRSAGPDPPHRAVYASGRPPHHRLRDLRREGARAHQEPRHAAVRLRSSGQHRDHKRRRRGHLRIKRDERHEGLYLVARRFRADHDIHATVSGKEIVLERGERLSMNFSYLYTRRAFHWLLEEHGNLNVLDETVSADGRFVVAVCSR